MRMLGKYAIGVLFSGLIVFWVIADGFPAKATEPPAEPVADEELVFVESGELLFTASTPSKIHFTHGSKCLVVACDNEEKKDGRDICQLADCIAGDYTRCGAVIEKMHDAKKAEWCLRIDGVESCAVLEKVR